MKPQAVVKERVDTRILEEIVVAPPARSKFALAQPSRHAEISKFAVEQPSRYAVSRYAPSRYSVAPTPSRYAGVSGRPSRYGRSQPAGGRRIVRRIVVIVPKARTEGRLLWVPAAEFEQSFEGWAEDGVWPLGAVIEFDAATESRSWQVNDDDARVHAYTIDDERSTFGCDDWMGCDSEGWPDVMAKALRLRAELAKEPERVARSLDVADLRCLATMLGMTTLPTHLEVARAIHADHTSGLGAAALDHAVWIIPGLFGHLGVQLAEQLKVIVEEEYVRLTPQENFLLHTGSLHPGTVGEQGRQPPGHLSYPMHGDYVVAKISYRSDPDGTVVGGWRSVYLEPFGEPQYPPKNADIN